MLSGVYIQNVLSEYRDKRSKKQQKVDRITAQLLQDNPELREARRRLSSLKRNRSSDKSNHADNAIMEAEQCYSQALSKALECAGRDASDLYVVPDCPTCGDTGYTGEDQRHYCPCLLNRVTMLMLKTAQLNENFTFEQFNLSIFSDGKDKNGLSHRELMQRLKNRAMSWCEAFPKNDKKQMLLIGNTGLGKSYLLNCIAHAVIEKGHTALLTTSNGINEATFKAMKESSDLLDTLRSIELLLIDDLGAEPVYNNITRKALFSMVEHRMVKGLHTIIATNLDLPQLEETYGQRIFSRLTHKQNTSIYRLTGVDVRRL